jgi:hypothetical protein
MYPSPDTIKRAWMTHQEYRETCAMSGADKPLWYPSQAAINEALCAEPQPHLPPDEPVPGSDTSAEYVAINEIRRHIRTHEELRENMAKMSSSASEKLDTETYIQEAARITSTDRQETYGPPEVNHQRTAELWSAFLGVRITPKQVCWLNVLQKASREAHRPGRDNAVDCIGYLANSERCGE